MISALQTYLLSLYYTPERISDFFASAKDVVVRQGDVVRTINLTHILDSIHPQSKLQITEKFRSYYNRRMNRLLILQLIKR